VTAAIEKGQKLVLQCTGMDREGAATARHEFSVVHVAGALPDESVKATVIHVSPHQQAGSRHAWAELDALEQASPDRDAPPCPAHGHCTSCPLMSWAYPAQLRWKHQLVAQALAAHHELAQVPVSPCVASPLPLGYRGNAKLVYGRDREGKLVLGAYAPRSHEIVDMAGCPLSEPVLVEVAAALHKLLLEQEVECFNEVQRTGMLRYVLMRANAQGKVLVTLVSARAPWPQAQALANALAVACPGVCGVVHNVNASTGNVLLGKEEHLLWGSAFIEDTIGPARVRLGPLSFAQANRQVAGLAYAAIVSAAQKLGAIDRVVDAYAGAGGIALSLAPLVTEVVAIEENPTAAATAQAFITETMAGARVRFVAGDVADHIAQVGRADVVVLNPPRKGCAPAVLAAVAQLAPRLVAYLSCNPETLARDMAALARLGFPRSSVTPFDMLAHTPHVEALALLGR
jgi:23S rRNA (uracil1939-C5)-methyltransferase